MYDDLRKKQRGQKRKLNQLLVDIDDLSIDNDISDKYEHFHLPCFNDFLDSSKTKGNIKRKVFQSWLDKTQYLIENKLSNLEFCKIVCFINDKYPSNSQIIIFYERECYDSYFTKYSESEKWVQLSDKSLKNSYTLRTNMIEKGFKRNINDEDYFYDYNLWFYGEL